MGKTGKKYKTYSPEFKISVIMDMREHHLNYHETMRKYFPELKQKNYAFVQKWERIFLEEGAEGLMKERRGGIRKSHPLKLDKKIQEDLIAENQRLKMEIEYLKKLDALVQKRIQEEGKKRR